MANSNRLNKNRNGQMFIPMNVEGGAWEEGFFTSTKVCILIAAAFINAAVIMWLSTLYVGWVFNVIIVFLLLMVDQLVVRYFIFEEKYYYRMYQKMKQFEVSTPAVFWDVSSLKDTDDGAIIVYSDAKIGIVVRVERDTITGKEPEFREQHYDAISDFYKEINLKLLKFVQMNIMEPAGKDPRLPKLDELVLKASNKNIAKIVEAQVGYIKKITRATLFESDYWLFYTDDTNRSDTLVSDVIDCIYKLLDGAYVGFSILNSNDILEMMKEEYGVKYFDYTEATVGMFRNSGLHIPKAFTITGVNYASGESQIINNVENNRLITLASYINKGVLKDGDWTVREALKGKIRKVDEPGIKRKTLGLSDIEGLGQEESETADKINLDDTMFELDEVQKTAADAWVDKATKIMDDLLYPNTEDKNSNLIPLESIAEEIGELAGDQYTKTEEVHSKKRLFEKKDKNNGERQGIQLDKTRDNIEEKNQQNKEVLLSEDYDPDKDDDIIDF